MGARARLDEGQGHRAPGAQVLGVDRRLHPLVALDLPADVDLQAGVRRVWPVDRAPQVLLSLRRVDDASVARGWLERAEERQRWLASVGDEAFDMLNVCYDM